MTQTVAPADTRTLRVAVAGNPNSGKTTIFNGLTGMRLKVGNYAGVTVERREGRLRGDPDNRTLLVDMPGTYSLAARSLDERIARDVLLGWQPGEPPPDAVIVVLDASNLERNLYLATQILELNLPVVFLCNMMDVARSRGLTISLSRLRKAFGVPVIATIGNRAEGLDEAVPALRQVLRTPPAHRAACPLPEPIEQYAAQLGRVLIRHNLATARTARGAALLLLLRPSQVEHGIDEPLPAEVDQALHDARTALAAAGYDDLSALLVQRRYEWLDERLAGVLRQAPSQRETLSDRIDHVLTHKILGMAIFAAVMFGMFAAIFWMAEPLMGFVEGAVTFVQEFVRTSLPEGVLNDLLSDGVIAGVGSIVIFLPQICLLFLFIAILEDSGYMARAAFLMDRIMRRVGLHGKSFIPLLSSMACTVPGIMATRTIENRRDRLATILVAPLISCSARLPVYFILIALIFPREQTWTKAGTLAAIYLAGIFLALGIATLLKKTVLRGPTPMFIMELPPYRLPSLAPVIRVVWDRARAFLARAGTYILAASIVLWAIFYWPKPPAGVAGATPCSRQTDPASPADPLRELGVPAATGAAPSAAIQASGTADTSAVGTIDSSPEPALSLPKGLHSWETLAGSPASSSSLSPVGTTEPFASSPIAVELADASPSPDTRTPQPDPRPSPSALEYSLAGRLGKFIEPIIRPLGYDWRIGVGIIASFTAREIFVSTMGIVYSVDDTDDGSGALRSRMQAAVTPGGKPIFSKAACLSLLVFYTLAMQCISTLAVAYRETGSWRWPAFMWTYMTTLAYAAAWATYHVASAFGLAA